MSHARFTLAARDGCRLLGDLHPRSSGARGILDETDAATHGIEELRRVIRHIELRWEDSVRVDPLAPGLAVLAAPYHEVRVDSAGKRVVEVGYFTGVAEHGADGWRLRDAHWSVVGAPAPVR